MAKARSIYTCTECGGQNGKWLGQCPHCKQWDTLVETVAESVTSGSNRFTALAGRGKLQRLSDVEAREESRLPTGVSEFDRVLGGGSGTRRWGPHWRRPGHRQVDSDAGQALCAMGGDLIKCSTSAAKSRRIRSHLRRQAALAWLYASALHLENSRNQFGENTQAVLQDEKPAVAVIDSIGTLYSEALQSVPCRLAQVRECAAQLTRLAKATGITIVFVGHVTKEGALAGPPACRAHCRHRALFRGRYPFELPSDTCFQKPVRRSQ